MPSSTASDLQYRRNMRQILTNTPYTPPTTLYVALMITVPNSANTGGTEVSGVNYARVAVPCTVANWTESGNLFSNTNELTWQVPGGAWGTVTGACLFDAATGGQMIYFATLTTSKTISAGDGAPRILAGQLQFNRATC